MKVLHYFYDLQDGNYWYETGDDYPRSGYAPTEERVKELTSKSNAMGIPLIEKKKAATKKKAAK